MTQALPPERSAGIIGRTLRLLLGVFLLWMTASVVRHAATADMLRAAAVILGLAGVYLLLHIGIRRFAPAWHPWFGALVALLPVTAVFVLGGSLGRIAAVAFIGLSLLVQAVRGDGGCEVMALPGLLTRHRTHLACILFAPIDLVEEHLTGPGGLPG
jgi:hypothetical protein